MHSDLRLLPSLFVKRAQVHGERCTEGFYRENLAGELQGMRASEEEKQKMLLTLQRLHMDEEAQPLGGVEEDGESCSDLSKLTSVVVQGGDTTKGYLD